MKCTQRIFDTDSPDILFRPCATCGHVLLLHGGFHQPNVQECVICTVLEVKQQKEAIQRLAYTPTIRTKPRKEDSNEVPVPDLRS